MLIDLKNDKLIRKFPAQNHSINAILDLGNDKILCQLELDIINIWNKKTGDLINTFETNDERIKSIILIDNGYVVSLSDEGKIKIWNVEKGLLIREMSEQKSFEYICALPNGQLLTFSSFNSARIWDTKTGQLVKTLPNKVLENLNYEYSLLVTPFSNGFFALAKSYIRVFDSKTGNLVCMLEGHAQAISKIKMLKNGLLATASFDKTIKIWNLDDCSLVKTLGGDTFTIMWLDEFDDGILIALSERNLFLVRI